MTRCDRIISDLNCNIIVQGDEFEYQINDQGEFVLDEHGDKVPLYAYVYILQLNKTNNQHVTQSFVKLHEDDIVLFSNKEDGYYTLCTIKLPLDSSQPYYYDSGFYKNDPATGQSEETTIGEIINLNPNFENSSEEVHLDISYDSYFSVCHLRKCFIKMCQEIFNSRATIRCETRFKDSLTYNRDLVWAALNVIQYLVDFEQYGEAQRILERISGCNGLCKESEGGDCGCL